MLVELGDHELGRARIRYRDAYELVDRSLDREQEGASGPGEIEERRVEPGERSLGREGAERVEQFVAFEPGGVARTLQKRPETLVRVRLAHEIHGLSGEDYLLYGGTVGRGQAVPGRNEDQPLH